MPADFDRCISMGGRVRTKKLSGGKYMHICFKDGKSYAGEVKVGKKATVKKTKGSKKSGRVNRLAIYKKK